MWCPYVKDLYRLATVSVDQTDLLVEVLATLGNIPYDETPRGFSLLQLVAESGGGRASNSGRRHERRVLTRLLLRGSSLYGSEVALGCFALPPSQAPSSCSTLWWLRCCGRHGQLPATDLGIQQPS